MLQFFGLTLDSQMTWKKHADILSNKCSRAIVTLYRIKHFIPTQIIVMLYNTIILPHFNDCIMAWGYQSNKIIKHQKRALRTISKSKYKAHRTISKIAYNSKNSRYTYITDIAIFLSIQQQLTSGIYAELAADTK